MLKESKSKIGYSSLFNVHQANFKSADLLHKMALGYIFIAGSVKVVCAYYFAARKIGRHITIQENQSLRYTLAKSKIGTTQMTSFVF